MSERLFADSPTALRALPEEKLPDLCASLREEIIATCGEVGGHLGASLGAVELIVALHRVFHTPYDKLVFDVGHQAYAHKLLTGRRERFSTLRQSGGVAPFLDPDESEHDAFGAGHACTAVSVALGLLEARAVGEQPGHVVAIVGDGALTGGLTFEGLNNAGYGARPLVVVLNDNQMSISENVGAIARLLPDQARGFFEALGFSYLGPIDGHDVPALVAALRQAKASNQPVLVHARTKKGQGFAPAEADGRTRGHAMGPFEMRDGKLVRSRKGQRTYSDVFAEVLDARLEKDPRAVVVTPAMLEGSSLVALKAKFPDRVFDVGISEQHAVAFSAGLAKAGARPICCLYSTFLQRAVDQIIHDVALPELPVVFAVDRAGLVGADGATHQGAYDLALLRLCPGLTVLAPSCGGDLEPMLTQALALAGPSALRFPRGTVEQPLLERSPSLSARWLKRAATPRLTFVAAGPLAFTALEAAAAQPDWSVLDAQWVSPLDLDALRIAAGGAVITVEEASSRGGFGSAVLEALAALGLQPRVRQLALPGDRFIEHGEARTQRAQLGLDVAGLQSAALALLNQP